SRGRRRARGGWRDPSGQGRGGGVQLLARAGVGGRGRDDGRRGRGGRGRGGHGGGGGRGGGGGGGGGRGGRGGRRGGGGGGGGAGGVVGNRPRSKVRGPSRSPGGSRSSRGSRRGRAAGWRGVWTDRRAFPFPNRSRKREKDILASAWQKVGV